MSWSLPFLPRAPCQRCSLTPGGRGYSTSSSPSTSLRNSPKPGGIPIGDPASPPTSSAEAIALLRSAAIVTALTVEVTGVATHPEDDLILATAVAGAAAYLVTGDRRLRAVGAFQGVAILSPREFLERLWLIPD